MPSEDPMSKLKQLIAQQTGELSVWAEGSGGPLELALSDPDRITLEACSLPWSGRGHRT